ncbi:MAG: DUF1638 domain-containing protein [Bacillota bacterium]
MRLKIIACEVFVREVCHAVARSPHIVDMEFTPKDAHDDSDNLKKLIQEKIDETEEDEVNYDAILMGYGLCGNSILGITSSKIPLVVPRAHDCCTIFLGSREKFKKHFGDRLSSRWSSPGYLERGESMFRDSDDDELYYMDQSYQDLVEQYGEENAKYVWEQLHPDMEDDNLIYIDIPEFQDLGYEEKIKKEAEETGKKFEKIPGDMRIIENLIFGNWEEDFLVVNPGEKIKAVYDLDQVIIT